MYSIYSLYIYISYKGLLISEQYGFGQLMSERRLILVNNHLIKPFPICLWSQTEVFLGDQL